MPPTAFLHPFAKPTLPAESYVTVVRGEGALVWDDAGREYVDAMASLWYCNVGHGRGEVVDAVATQMRSLAAFHCFDKFTNSPAEELAEALAERAPMDGARVFFTSSGSEAVESAVKLARLSFVAAGQPERTVIVSRAPSYHGVTTGALALTGLPLNQAGYGPLLGDVVQVPAHDVEALAEVLAQHRGRVAAIIAEPVIGAGGVFPPVEGYHEGIRRLADREGCLVIADEVICGFGRLGHWWGSQRYGVVPDLVTFAKGVTSGYVPLGGVLVGRGVLDPLEADPELVLRHGHTYSGHPTACAAGSAVLRITEDEDLIARSVPLGQRLEAGLRSLEADGRLRGVRGAGAVWAAQLHDGVGNAEVRDRMLDEGVIARPLGLDAIAFCPPLVTPDALIDRCVDALATALPA